MLYTFNLYNIVYQLYINKPGGESSQKKGILGFRGARYRSRTDTRAKNLYTFWKSIKERSEPLRFPLMWAERHVLSPCP